jgi:hypothetical protein
LKFSEAEPPQIHVHKFFSQALAWEKKIKFLTQPVVVVQLLVAPSSHQVPVNVKTELTHIAKHKHRMHAKTVFISTNSMKNFI